MPPERPSSSGRGRGVGKGGLRGWVSPEREPLARAPRRPALQAAAPSSSERASPALRRSRSLRLYAFLYSPTVFLTFIFSFMTAAQAHSPVEEDGNVWVAAARDPAGSPAGGPAVWAALARRRRLGSRPRPPVLAARAALGPRERSEDTRVCKVWSTQEHMQA